MWPQPGKERTMTESLSSYVAKWVGGYRQKQQAIPLFNPTLTRGFSLEQKRLFFERLNELRRHFNALLGDLMAFAPSQAYKQALLSNLMEETGVSKDGTNMVSHDELYNISARAVGVEMIQSIHRGRTKTPYGKEFNEKFSAWIIEQLAVYGAEKGWNRIWAAVEAYEKLDNVDYPAFLELAKSFGLTGEALVFFDIHVSVEHYEHGEKLLEDVWERDPDSVRAGFQFIEDIQLTALRALSDDISTYAA